MKSFIASKISVITLVLVFVGLKAHSQFDPMYTQYMWNEMYINPAYAGAREAICLTALSRTQWVGLEGAPQTQTFSAHTPMFQSTVGVGLNFLHETIGVSNRIYATGAFAYRIKFPKGKLSFGLSGGVINAGEDLQKLNVLDNSDVTFQANAPRLSMPNAGFGTYYYTDKWYAGLSMPRLIENNVDELNSYDVKSTFNPRNLHYYLTGGYVFNLKKGMKLKPTAMMKNVYGSPIEIDLSLNAFLKDMLWVGFAWRSGDAGSALLAMQISPNLRFGYSYDYSFTSIRNYSAGSHELSIGYDFNPNSKRIVSPRLF